MAKQTITTPAPHHYFRTIVSSFFGFFALALIIMSILAFWLDSSLTNTNQFVKIVGPLVTKAEVQNFVVNKASDALLDNKDAPIRDISEKLLGQEAIAGKTDEQLKTEITPIIKESLTTVISSAAFASLWQTSITNVHSQLITQLNAKSETITLNLHPVIVGAIDQLTATKLSFVKDKIELKADVGVVVIKDNQLTTMRQVFDYFKKAVLAIIALAVLSLVLCVLISVHHLKTFRRIAIVTGVFTGLLAIALSATSLVKIGTVDLDTQKMVVVVVDSITSQLRTMLIVISAACITAAIASKVIPMIMVKRQTK